MKKGFTLIETLIYIALFALLIGGGVGAAYSLIESSDRIGVHAMLEEEGNFLLAKIRWSLENPGTTIGVNEKNEMTLSYGATPIPISNTNVSVEDFVLGSVDVSDGLEKITYSFTLSTNTGGGQETSEQFNATHYVRK